MHRKRNNSTFSGVTPPHFAKWKHFFLKKHFAAEPSLTSVTHSLKNCISEDLSCLAPTDLHLNYRSCMLYTVLNRKSHCSCGLI